MPRLTIFLPDHSQRVISLPESESYFARIGRDEHCELCFPIPSLSGEHALLRGNKGVYELEDLGSTNGVCINGYKIHSVQELSSGDEAVLGDVRLAYHDPRVDEQGDGAPQRSSVPSPMLSRPGSKKAKFNGWMCLYALVMFCLAVVTGLTYKHYRITGDLLPLQWLGVESPKESHQRKVNEKQKKAQQKENPQKELL